MYQRRRFLRCFNLDTSSATAERFLYDLVEPVVYHCACIQLQKRSNVPSHVINQIKTQFFHLVMHQLNCGQNERSASTTIKPAFPLTLSLSGRPVPRQMIAKRSVKSEGKQKGVFGCMSNIEWLRPQSSCARIEFRLDSVGRTTK